MIRILIAEGQPIIRQQLEQLAIDDGYEVIGAVSDGFSALHEANRVSPDVLIIALKLDHLGGLEVIQRLRQRGSDTKALVFSSYDSPHSIETCMRVGAAGFVSKNDELDQLRLALKALASKRTYFPMLPSDAPSTGRASARDAKSHRTLPRLSPRELTIWRLLAEGRGNREIAEQLCISDRTVSTHKARLMRKLNARSVVDLAELSRELEHETPDSEHKDLDFLHDGHDLPDSLRMLLDAIPSGITIRDRAGRLVFGNAFLARLYGDPEADPWRQTVGELSLLAEDERRELEAVYHDAMEKHREFRHEAILRFRGEELAVTYWGAPLKVDDNGEVQAMVAGVFANDSAESEFMALRKHVEEAAALSTLHVNLLVEFGRKVERALGVIETVIPEFGNHAAQNEAVRAARNAVDDLRLALRTVSAAQASVVKLGPRRSRENLSRLTKSILAEFVETERLTPGQLTADVADRGWDIWVDTRGYQRLLEALLHWAIDCGLKPHVMFRQRLQPRGLMESEVVVSYETAEHLEPSMLPLWRALTAAYGAALHYGREGDKDFLTLALTATRAAPDET